MNLLPIKLNGGGPGQHCSVTKASNCAPKGSALLPLLRSGACGGNQLIWTHIGVSFSPPPSTLSENQGKTIFGWRFKKKNEWKNLKNVAERWGEILVQFFKDLQCYLNMTSSTNGDVQAILFCTYSWNLLWSCFPVFQLVISLPCL